MLSIITTYYQQYKFFRELADTLGPQLTQECEWIVVDDGCHDNRLDDVKATVIHLENNSGGASHPRNVGLSMAKGDYVVFIDGDDLVSNQYISAILTKIHSSDFDYCLFSWKTIGSHKYTVIIKDKPPIWNCSIWNCIYKRELIGDVKFDESLKIAEDYKFNAMVRRGKKDVLDKILYYYRTK